MKCAFPPWRAPSLRTPERHGCLYSPLLRPPRPPHPAVCVVAALPAADASFSLSRRDLSVCTRRAPTPGPGPLPSLRAAPLGPLAFLQLPLTPPPGAWRRAGRGQAGGCQLLDGRIPPPLGLPGVKMGEAAPTRSFRSPALGTPTSQVGLGRQFWPLVRSASLFQLWPVPSGATRAASLSSRGAHPSVHGQF